MEGLPRKGRQWSPELAKDSNLDCRKRKIVSSANPRKASRNSDPNDPRESLSQKSQMRLEGNHSIFFESDQYSEIDFCQEQLFNPPTLKQEIKKLNKNISSKIIEYFSLEKNKYAPRINSTYQNSIDFLNIFSENEKSEDDYSLESLEKKEKYMNIINQNIPELIFLEVVNIINNGLLFIKNNLKKLSEIMLEINNYIFTLYKLRNIFSNIYRNITKHRRKLEFSYMSYIPQDGMSFSDFEKIQNIRYSKIKIHEEDTEKLISIFSTLNSIKIITLKVNNF